MSDKRAALLEELATDAGRQRDDFLDEAGRQFVQFLDANRGRLKELGGLVLIDEEPDYLFITPDGTFRSRTRYQDDEGVWQSDTEDFDDGADLVEVYNPADLYAAFVDAAKAEIEGPVPLVDEDGDTDEDEGAGDGEAAAEDELPDEEAPATDELYPWLDRTPLAPVDQADAARQMYDLALTFQEGSQYEQARLLDDFAERAAPAAALLGESTFVDDVDERLTLRVTGAIEGAVVPEGGDDDAGEPEWQQLTSSDDLVQFYDPTDLFGDLAEAIADSYPDVAPELIDEADDAATDDKD